MILDQVIVREYYVNSNQVFEIFVSMIIFESLLSHFNGQLPIKIQLCVQLYLTEVKSEVKEEITTTITRI